LIYESKIAHIGIAVENIDKAEKVFSAVLGTAPKHREDLPDHLVKTVTFCLGDSEIELLEGTSEKSPIKKFRADAKRDAIHHLAIEVADINEKIAELLDKGFDIIDGYPRQGKEGSKVAFVHPKGTGGVLLELVQKQNNP
jgi:methylmalonyl-CoA/ethylmalonyl-CoA epimerase